jgi:galactokinase/mevalonate kinase-like predicted kinase
MSYIKKYLKYNLRNINTFRGGAAFIRQQPIHEPIRIPIMVNPRLIEIRNILQNIINRPVPNERLDQVYEMVQNLNEIKHAVIRNVLNKFKNEVFFKKAGLEVHYDGDFPSRTGIGSSSAFSVGFLNLMNNFFKKKISKKKLAHESICLEQDVLKETVGSQDQISTSYGGFNEINFFKNGGYEVIPLITNKNDLIALENQMILV